MAVEYLDVVDENNRLMGEKRLRTEVHAQGLWHRTVHIYLFREVNGKIQILVHLRSKTKDSMPGRWDTRFGGHVKAGEAVGQAVRGELHDEIGLEIAPAQLMQGETYKRDSDGNREFTVAYYYRFTGNDSSLAFNDGEVERIQWMDEDEIGQALRIEPENWAASLAGFEEVMKVLAIKLNGDEATS